MAFSVVVVPERAEGKKRKTPHGPAGLGENRR
jgi:hypothetical protein